MPLLALNVLFYEMMVDGEFLFPLTFLFRIIKSWQHNSSPPNFCLPQQIRETQTPVVNKRSYRKIFNRRGMKSGLSSRHMEDGHEGRGTKEGTLAAPA